jgi:hypothetical protein
MDSASFVYDGLARELDNTGRAADNLPSGHTNHEIPEHSRMITRRMKMRLWKGGLGHQLKHGKNTIHRWQRSTY